jgi:hypothetical protein
MGLAGLASLDAATVLFGAFTSASVSPVIEPTDTPIETQRTGTINRESENGDDAGSLGTDTKATWGDSMREAIVLRRIGLLKDFLWGPGTAVIELFPPVIINPPKGSLLNCHAPGSAWRDGASRNRHEGKHGLVLPQLPQSA